MERDSNNKSGDEKRFHDGIRPEHVARCRRKTRIGEKVPVRVDDEVKELKVVAKYPHIVLLSDGHSITWAQMAGWIRKGRRGYIT